MPLHGREEYSANCVLEGGCACGEVRSSSGGTGTGTGPGSPRSKVEWVTIPDGVPAFDDHYDMKKLCRQRA
jgi:hypothetical protein